MSDLVDRLLGKGVGGAVAWVGKATDLCVEAADEIKTLRSEAAENAKLLGMSAERETRLRAELDALREDAERYRWMRKQEGIKIDRMIDGCETETDVDAAIDKARKEVK